MLVLNSCKKSVCVSDCIQSKLDQFIPTVHFGGASVKEYGFQGKSVYVFDNGSMIVDGAALVYNANCDYLGALGGIGGLTKINGVDFYSNASYKRTLWHN